MSKYTTELRFLCESLAGETESVGGNSVANIIAEARPHIFNFNYPIFDQAYKPVLETKILRHYYTREISEETVGLWKLRLEDRLNIIMPYYNKLYESELLAFNPLNDTNLTRNKSGKYEGEKSRTDTLNSENESTGNEVTTNKQTMKGDSDRTAVQTEKTNSTVNTQGTNNEWNLYSDTPQGGVVGIASAVDPTLGTNAYLTNARHITDATTGSEVADGDAARQGTTKTKETQETDNASQRSGIRKDINSTTNESEETFTNTDAYLESIIGKTGGKTYSAMLNEYRTTFLNIDKKIIEELSDLFFGLW